MDRIDYLDQLEAVAVRAYLRCYGPDGASTDVERLPMSERFHVQKGIEAMRFAVAQEMQDGKLQCAGT